MIDYKLINIGLKLLMIAILCLILFQDIKEISVFISDDYYLEDGSDGEDTFKNAECLFNIPLNISYNEYVNKLKQK